MKPNRRILLVDDMPSLRALLQAVLEKADFRVLAAADGEEAVRVAKGLQEPVDLLITDLTMPGLGGRQVAAELRRGRPDLPVLFMSGTEESVDVMMQADGRRTWWLSKPFTPEELTAMVREILGPSAT